MTTKMNTPRLLELARVFTRLGATAFGGPLAHIALMESECVGRLKWLSREHFLDIVGATNLIPGPNSTETAMHIGFERAGRAGLIVAGVCFILPAFVLVLILASIYARMGQLPPVRALLAGIAPVVLAIIAQAAWKLGRTALKNRATLVVALLSIGALMLGANEVVVIGVCALCGLMAGRTRHPRDAPQKTSAPAPALMLGTFGFALSKSALGVGWIFLKIGCVVYGSGYVLIAFLRADLVERLKWISESQLLDAIAVGQMTPGPVFTTATFIGFQIAGWWGALAATLGIFAPPFVFVAVLAPVLKRARSSPMLRVFLDWINAASLALMAVVAAQMVYSTLLLPAFQWQLAPMIVFLAALALLFRGVNSVYLIGAGALCGLLISMR